MSGKQDRRRRPADALVTEGRRPARYVFWKCKKRITSSDRISDSVLSLTVDGSRYSCTAFGFRFSLAGARRLARGAHRRSTRGVQWSIVASARKSGGETVGSRVSDLPMYIM